MHLRLLVSFVCFDLWLWLRCRLLCVYLAGWVADCDCCIVWLGLLLLLCFNCILLTRVWCLVWYNGLLILAFNSVGF